MNPPNWPTPKPRACPCDDCHIGRFEDLAYAVAKGGDPITGPIVPGLEPGGDAMHWTPNEEDA